MKIELPLLTSPALQQAYDFAASKHAGQLRKGSGLPYIMHPLTVAQLLWGIGERDEDILVAALLHDVSEDTDTPLAEIAARFGPRVAEIVGVLTKPSEGGLAAQIAQVATADSGVQRIKLADRLHNLSEGILWFSADRFQLYQQKTHPLLAAIPRAVAPSWWDRIAWLSGYQA